MQDYEKRLNITIIGNDNTSFYTKSGLLIAKGYQRIVIGKRGPYIEFDVYQIKTKNIIIPDEEKWRMSPDNLAFYVEFRTIDKDCVKIYFQKRTVDYADYLVNKFYISPFDLSTDDCYHLIEPLENEEKNNFDVDKFF